MSSGSRRKETGSYISSVDDEDVMTCIQSHKT